MNESTNIELAFHQRMRRIYDEARSECNYTATRFLQLVNDLGGVQAAKQLLGTEGYSEGLTRLWEEGRLDISMEAAVLEDQWRNLFTNEELATAGERLEQLGFRVEKGVKRMDERVRKLATPEKCEIFARNANDRNRPDLAREARARAVELRAESHGAKSEAENEALQAVYAYEEVLSQKNGKRTRASRTWQMIKRHGIIEAVERAVNRSSETQGYTSLVEMGLEEFAFEAVILRYPEQFSEAAVKKSKERLASWRHLNHHSATRIDPYEFR